MVAGGRTCIELCEGGLPLNVVTLVKMLKLSCFYCLNYICHHVYLPCYQCLLCELCTRAMIDIVLD